MKKLVPIFVLLFAMTSFGQNDTKAILVDEIDKVLCDDFLARIDNFYIQINNEPASAAYFVITGSNKFLTYKLYTELLFESAFAWRRFDRTRVKIVRGIETGPFQVKLWIVRAGGETPDFRETRWNLRLPTGSQPFLLRSDMAQICEPPPVERIAKELIDANHDGSIFVVVHGPTLQKRKVELRLARKMLTRLEPERVRYLFRHSPTAYSDYYFALRNPKRTDFKSYF